MTSLEDEIEEFVEDIESCPKCHHTEYVAHFEDSGGYVIDMTKEEGKRVSEGYNDGSQYIVIVCSKCGEILVDDLFC